MVSALCGCAQPRRANRPPRLEGFTFLGVGIFAEHSASAAYCFGVGGSYRRLLTLTGCGSPRWHV